MWVHLHLLLLLLLLHLLLHLWGHVLEGGFSGGCGAGGIDTRRDFVALANGSNQLGAFGRGGGTWIVGKVGDGLLHGGNGGGWGGSGALSGASFDDLGVLQKLLDEFAKLGEDSHGGWVDRGRGSNEDGIREILGWDLCASFLARRLLDAVFGAPHLLHDGENFGVLLFRLCCLICRQRLVLFAQGVVISNKLLDLLDLEQGVGRRFHRGRRGGKCLGNRTWCRGGCGCRGSRCHDNFLVVLVPPRFT